MKVKKNINLHSKNIVNVTFTVFCNEALSVKVWSHSLTKTTGLMCSQVILYLTYKFVVFCHALKMLSHHHSMYGLRLDSYRRKTPYII